MGVGRYQADFLLLFAEQQRELRRWWSARTPEAPRGSRREVRGVIRPRRGSPISGSRDHYSVPAPARRQLLTTSPRALFAHCADEALDRQRDIRLASAMRLLRWRPPDVASEVASLRPPRSSQDAWSVEHGCGERKVLDIVICCRVRVLAALWNTRWRAAAGVKEGRRPARRSALPSSRRSPRTAASLRRHLRRRGCASASRRRCR